MQPDDVGVTEVAKQSNLPQHLLRLVCIIEHFRDSLDGNWDVLVLVNCSRHNRVSSLSNQLNVTVARATLRAGAIEEGVGGAAGVVAQGHGYTCL